MKNKLSLTVALAVGFLSAPAILAMEPIDEVRHICKSTVDSNEKFNAGHECYCVNPKAVKGGKEPHTKKKDNE